MLTSPKFCLSFLLLEVFFRQIGLVLLARALPHSHDCLHLNPDCLPLSFCSCVFHPPTLEERVRTIPLEFIKHSSFQRVQSSSLSLSQCFPSPQRERYVEWDKCNHDPGSKASSRCPPHSKSKYQYNGFTRTLESYPRVLQLSQQWQLKTSLPPTARPDVGSVPLGRLVRLIFRTEDRLRIFWEMFYGGYTFCV